MAARRLLWVVLAVAAVAALLVWTPMTLAPAALFFGLLLAPFLFLVALGLYHIVHGARRRPGV